MSRLLLALLLVSCGGPASEPGSPRAGISEGVKPAPAGLMTPDEVVPLTTDDGWTLALRHYAAPGPPVLLVHGLGVVHRHFDLVPDVSLAADLEARGWDVWVATLRGDPGTVPPPGVPEWDVSMEEHVLHDAPALVSTVLQRTGRPALSWVGHSMGGMILYGVLRRDPAAIAAGVAVASPACLAEKSADYRLVERQAALLPRRGRLPSRRLLKSTLVLGKSNLVTERLAHMENLDDDLVPLVLDHVIRGIAAPMVADLRLWLRDGRFPETLAPPAHTPADVPLLVLSGTLDRVAPPANVACACATYQPCTYREVGLRSGFAHDYGHGDLIVSRPARAEIYPVIEAFLATHQGREVR